MQTFLPYPSFTKSAAVLDNKRLGKQRVEAKQIYLALTVAEYGWKNHPAVKMWQGYETGLLNYCCIICAEWSHRGFRDTVRDWAIGLPMSAWSVGGYYPPWFGNVDFHASHRSNLLRKDPTWYGKFDWTEPNDLPYVWPKP